MTLAAPGFSDAFQVAYVTRDIERAIAAFAAQHGVDRFDRVPADALELRIPPAIVSLKVAIAWIGDWQVELIQPVAGADDIYRRALPAGPDGQAMHHAGIRVRGDRAEWDRFRAGIDETRIALEGGRNEMRFIYVDERATLGHYLEYVWMSDAFIAANPIWLPPAG